MNKVEAIGFQGDCCLFRIDEFPTGNRVEDKQTKDGVLAYGEVTGHAHQFDVLEDVEVFKLTDTLYADMLFMNVKKDTILRHGRARGFNGVEADQDYHNVVKLPAGKYMAGIVQETDWLAKTSRRVAD
jgi:CBS-domain-containing membrane protein